MANIKVKEIQPAGIELFGDSESFMDELSGNELNNVIGGKTNTHAYTCTGARTCAKN